MTVGESINVFLHQLTMATGEDKPIIEITVAPKVWDKIAFEVEQASRYMSQGLINTFNQIQFMDVQIIRGQDEKAADI